MAPIRREAPAQSLDQLCAARTRTPNPRIKSAGWARTGHASNCRWPSGTVRERAVLAARVAVSAAVIISGPRSLSWLALTQDSRIPAVQPATCAAPTGGKEDDDVYYVQGAYHRRPWPPSSWRP